MDQAKKISPERMGRVRPGTFKGSVRGHAKSFNRRIKHLRSLTRTQRNPG